MSRPRTDKDDSAAKLLQSCPTLCDARDGSPPGSAVPGLLQARTLEWVAISFSNAWKWKWSHSVVSDSSQSHGPQPNRVLHPWDFPGRSTGVGYHCLFWSHDKSWTVFQISFQQVITCIVIYLINSREINVLNQTSHDCILLFGKKKGGVCSVLKKAYFCFRSCRKWKLKLKK